MHVPTSPSTISSAGLSMNNTSTPGTTPPGDNAALTLADVLSAPFKATTATRIPFSAGVSRKKRGPLPVPPVLPLSGATSSYRIDPRTGLPVGFVPSIPNQPAHVPSAPSQYRGVCSPSDEISALRRLQVLSRVAANEGKKNKYSGSYPSPDVVSHRVGCGPAALGPLLPPRPSTHSSFSSYERTPEQQGPKPLTRIDLLERVAAIADQSPRIASPALSIASNSTISHTTASTHECLCDTCKRGVELRQQSFRPTITRPKTQSPPPDQIAVIQRELKSLSWLVSTTFASLPFDVAEMLSSVHCLRDDFTALRSEFTSANSASPSSCPPPMPMPMPTTKPLQTPPVCPMPSLWNVSDGIGSGTITPEPPYTPVIPPPPSFDGYIPIQPPLPRSHFSRATSRATSPPLPSSHATPISSYRMPWVLPPIEPVSPPCMPTNELASIGMNSPEDAETVPRGFVPLSVGHEHGILVQQGISQPCLPSLGTLPPSLALPSLPPPQVPVLQPYPGCTLVPTSTTHAHTRFSLSSPDINEDCSPALSLSQHPLISCPPSHASMSWTQPSWSADIAAFMKSIPPPPPMPMGWCPVPMPVPQYSPPAPSTATATTTTSAGASAARVVPTAWVAQPTPILETPVHTPDSSSSSVSWIHERHRRLSTITEKTETSPPRVVIPQMHVPASSERTPKSSYGVPRQATATLRPVIPTWVPPLPMPSPSIAGSPVSTASSMFGLRVPDPLLVSPRRSSRPTRRECTERSSSRSVSRSPSMSRSERSRRRDRRDRDNDKVFRIEVNPTIIVCGGAQAGQQCNHPVPKNNRRSRSPLRSRSRSLRREWDVRRSRSPSPESYRGRSRSRTPTASHRSRSRTPVRYRMSRGASSGSDHRRRVCDRTSPIRRSCGERFEYGCNIGSRPSTPYDAPTPQSQPSLLATPQSSQQSLHWYPHRPLVDRRRSPIIVSPLPSVSALTMESCGTFIASSSPSVSTASEQMPSPLSCPSLVSPPISGQSSPVLHPYPYTGWTNEASPQVSSIPVVARSDTPSEEAVRHVQEAPKGSVLTWLAMEGVNHEKYEMSSTEEVCYHRPKDWRAMPQELYPVQTGSGSRAIPAKIHYSITPQEPLSRRASKAPAGPRRVVHGQAYPWGPIQASTAVLSDPEPMPIPVPEPAAPAAPASASELTVIPNPFTGSIFSSSASSTRSDSRCASEALAASQSGSICDYDARPVTRPSPTSQHYIPLVCSPEPLPHPHHHSWYPAPSMSRPVSQRPMYSYGPLVMTPDAMSPETLPHPPSSLSSPLAPMPTSISNPPSPPALVSTPPMPKTPSPDVDQPQPYTPGSNSSVLDLLERLPAPMRLPPVSSLMTAIAPRPAPIGGQSMSNRWHLPVPASVQQSRHGLPDVLPPVNPLFQHDNNAVAPVISTRKNPLFEWLGPDHSPVPVLGSSSSTLQTDSIPNITLPSLLDLLKDTGL